MNRRSKARIVVLSMLLVACVAAMPGASPGTDCEPGVHRSRSDRDPILESLENALLAYSRREVASARSWAALAIQLLERPNSYRREEPSRWPGGNSGQLLETLHLYAVYASGRQPELDIQYSHLLEQLQRIDWLNRNAGAARLGAESVDYDLIDRLVTRVGELRIEYDLITLQIRRIGAWRVEYDLILRRPKRIGDIEFEYDVHGRVRAIAGVRVAS